MLQPTFIFGLATAFVFLSMVDDALELSDAESESKKIDEKFCCKPIFLFRNLNMFNYNLGQNNDK